MIEVLLLTGSFFICFIIFFIVVVVYFKRWVSDNEEKTEKKFNELKDKINETQTLFRKEVSSILKSFKNILDK